MNYGATFVVQNQKNCSKTPDVCHANAACTLLSPEVCVTERPIVYRCVCNQGYIGDGTNCTGERSHVNTFSYHHHLIFLLGRHSLKRPKTRSFQITMNFGTIRPIPQLNTQRRTKSDFWYDVILSRWRPWRYFTLPAAAYHVCMRKSVGSSNSAAG